MVKTIFGRIMFSFNFYPFCCISSEFLMQIIEFPYIFAQLVAYSIIVYSMIWFEWTVAKFLWYLFYMWFTLLQFSFYGMMVVGVAPNHCIAAIFPQLLCNFWNSFTGFNRAPLLGKSPLDGEQNNPSLSDNIIHLPWQWIYQKISRK